MQDDYFIGIYWKARKEELETCVDKVIQTFKSLAEFDESLRRWYKTTKPKKGQVTEPIAPDRPSVTALLNSGRNINDLGQLLEDLGYLAYLKSGMDFSKSHVLSISCNISNERLQNSVTLNLAKGAAYEHLKNKDVMESIYKMLTGIWQPERGEIRPPLPA